MALWAAQELMCPNLPFSTVYTLLGLLVGLRGCSLSRGGNPGLFPKKFAELKLLQFGFSNWYLKWPVSPKLKQWLQREPLPRLSQLQHPLRGTLPCSTGLYCRWGLCLSIPSRRVASSAFNSLTSVSRLTFLGFCPQQGYGDSHLSYQLGWGSTCGLVTVKAKFLHSSCFITNCCIQFLKELFIFYLCVLETGFYFHFNTDIL